MDYRQSHQSDEVAESYARLYAGTNPYAELIWDIEKKEIFRVLSDLERLNKIKVVYLDFACGTGRLLSVFEQRAAKATGIDVSPNMLKIAKTQIRKASLIEKDITSPNDVIEGKYDLITAFRFFRNAQPMLRDDAMKALALRLKGRESRLVFNNHGRLLSLKAVTAPLHYGSHYLSKFSNLKSEKPKYLTDFQVRGLVDRAGLEIVETVGYGLFGQTGRSIFGHKLTERYEDKAKSGKIANLAGTHKIYVTRVKNI